MQRDYEEFKVRINSLVAMAQKVPEDGWTMQDGTPWPGNNVRDHPGMIQVGLVFHLVILCYLCITKLQSKVTQMSHFSSHISDAVIISSIHCV